jgi:hypothetical protein
VLDLLIVAEMDTDRPLTFECVFCQNGRRIFRQPLFKRRDGQILLSGEHAAHYYSVHGYDPETFIEMLRRVLR